MEAEEEGGGRRQMKEGGRDDNGKGVLEFWGEREEGEQVRKKIPANQREEFVSSHGCHALLLLPHHHVVLFSSFLLFLFELRVGFSWVWAKQASFLVEEFSFCCRCLQGTIPTVDWDPNFPCDWTRISEDGCVVWRIILSG